MLLRSVRLTALAIAVALPLNVCTTFGASVANGDAAWMEPAPQARVGGQVIVRDTIRSNSSPNDIYRVAVYAASSREPASLTISFNGPVPALGETRVNLNFDRDALPEAAIAMSGAHYRLFKVSGWRDHGVGASECGRVSASGFETTVEFSPVCLGARRRGIMAFSVVADYPDERTDFVPSNRNWSPRARTYVG